MKVLLKTPISPYSGFGNDGLGIAMALQRMGVDVYLEPTHVSPPLPPPVAALLTKRLVTPFDLLIHHVDPGQLGISPQVRKAVQTAVGWTMWEYSSVDNLKSRRTLRKRLRDYDLVLGYDSVSSGALAPYTDRQGTLQGGFWAEDWPPVARDWHGKRFAFCMHGALHQRKDPFVAIEAFRELKDEHPEDFEGAELHLHTVNPGLHMAMQEWVPKLRVHYAVWSHEVLREFYGSQHVMLLPSRGEGKSLPALEFQATGGAVIATNWGGPTQWLSSQYAYPLNYTLAPESPSQPECLSARASKEHLKHLMWQVFTHRDEVAAKAALAARTIPQMCSWDSVMDRLALKLGEHIPIHGAHLMHELRAGKERMNTSKPPVPAYA